MRAGARSSVVRAPRFGDDWWQRGVIYQIYPRSFADSDGDGIGDLPGIIDHLEQLGPDGLGVDAIWLSPIYPSPGRDLGYDVSDHLTIDPLFGTNEDFDRLVETAHRLGIRVVLDLVMNHTSDAHPWFQASRRRDPTFRDWYIWRDPRVDGRGRRRPPNDWVSWFGGPAWTYDEVRGQSYHHTFLPEQPELDWRVPAVEAAQWAMVRGWLERGVDGFRLDTFNVFLKDADMRSNPRRRGRSAWERQTHVYDIDQPDLPELLGRFRAVVDAFPGTMSVGELFVGTTEGAAALTTDRHLVFDWELLTRPWAAPAMARAFRRRERAFGTDRWPTVVLSNHDQPRHASRLAALVGIEDPAQQDEIARAAAVLILTVRGTPFLYYGEELGLGDTAIPPAERIDRAADRVSAEFSWWDRSPARTPMPWTTDAGAGFTTGRPWLRLGPDAATRNVAVQRDDPTSIWAAYRRMLAVRRSQPSLQDGSQRLVRTGDPRLLAYRRIGSGPEVLVAIAFTADGGETRLPRPIRGGGWRPIVGSSLEPSGPDDDGRRLRLRGFEAVVLVAEAGEDRR